MTSFTRQWNTAYEGLPADDEDARQGASRIREVKTDIAERMMVDHMWAGDDDDGRHQKVGLKVLATDPDTESDGGVVYAKQQGAGIQLYYKDSNGNVFPLTSSGGGIANIIIPGTILAIGNGSNADGVSYIQCDGQAVSRVNYAGLFAAISIAWGAGDGSLTFNVPDLRGRGLLGRGTGVGLSARGTGQLIGAENHVLTIPELPAHAHTIPINTGAGVPGGVAVQGVNAANATLNSGPIGAGNAFDKMSPFGVINWWIKT